VPEFTIPTNFQSEKMATFDKYETEQIGLWFAIKVNREGHVAFISTQALNERFEAEKNSN
jgi:hypothetical protein